MIAHYVQSAYSRAKFKILNTYYILLLYVNFSSPRRNTIHAVVCRAERYKDTIMMMTVTQAFSIILYK